MTRFLLVDARLFSFYFILPACGAMSLPLLPYPLSEKLSSTSEIVAPDRLTTPFYALFSPVCNPTSIAAV
ncbi:hypothetical protein [Alloprevotella tannerae]|uniref:hypothetical protein n=1 Tax=Alloprevotella tannerae TaxID=76122 RepID=UPI0028EC7C5D|nr:hypothetical protein [Alloprevotella tannerae]